MYPLDPGRRYRVEFNPAAVPGGALAHIPEIARGVEMPAAPAAERTKVSAIYPTGPAVPANLLRMYVEFSNPMGTRTGQDYIKILDASGAELPGALLPLDTDLWNGDHTRFTILFDPGRVKRGILPNRAMGRPLKAGGAFTIVVHPRVARRAVAAAGVGLPQDLPGRTGDRGAALDRPVADRGARGRIARAAPGHLPGAARSRPPPARADHRPQQRRASPARSASPAAKPSGASRRARPGRPAPTRSRCCPFSRIPPATGSGMRSRRCRPTTTRRRRRCACPSPSADLV